MLIRLIHVISSPPSRFIRVMAVFYTHNTYTIPDMEGNWIIDTQPTPVLTLPSPLPPSRMLPKDSASSF